MTAARGRANQALYLGKLVLASWRLCAEQEEIPATTLQQAFAPAVRDHFVAAYGWFLLELAGDDAGAPGVPPRYCSELPAVPEGKAVSGELREIEQLERSGFLTLFDDVSPDPGGSSVQAGSNLVTTRKQDADWNDFEAWAASFSGLCERMRNSLDEY